MRRRHRSGESNRRVYQTHKIYIFPSLATTLLRFLSAAGHIQKIRETKIPWNGKKKHMRGTARACIRCQLIKSIRTAAAAANISSGSSRSRSSTDRDAATRRQPSRPRTVSSSTITSHHTLALMCVYSYTLKHIQRVWMWKYVCVSCLRVCVCSCDHAYLYIITFRFALASCRFVRYDAGYPASSLFTINFHPNVISWTTTATVDIHSHVNIIHRFRL